MEPLDILLNVTKLSDLDRIVSILTKVLCALLVNKTKKEEYGYKLLNCLLGEVGVSSSTIIQCLHE